MRWIIKYLNKRLFLSYEELKTCKVETFENSSQQVIKAAKETLTIQWTIKQC